MMPTPRKRRGRCLVCSVPQPTTRYCTDCKTIMRSIVAALKPRGYDLPRIRTYKVSEVLR